MNLQFFQTFSGWRYTYPSEKYEFVNGKDDIPYMMESHKIHVPNHQPVFKSNETTLDMLTFRPCWLVQLWVNSGPWDNHGAINDHIFGTIRRGWSDYTPMGFARSFSVQAPHLCPIRSNISHSKPMILQIYSTVSTRSIYANSIYSILSSFCPHLCPSMSHPCYLIKSREIRNEIPCHPMKSEQIPWKSPWNSIKSP